MGWEIKLKMADFSGNVIGTVRGQRYLMISNIIIQELFLFV